MVRYLLEVIDRCEIGAIHCIRLSKTKLELDVNFARRFFEDAEGWTCKADKRPGHLLAIAISEKEPTRDVRCFFLLSFYKTTKIEYGASIIWRS